MPVYPDIAIYDCLCPDNLGNQRGVHVNQLGNKAVRFESSVKDFFE